MIKIHNKTPNKWRVSVPINYRNTNTDNKYTLDLR